jgi:hypothetical protein
MTLHRNVCPIGYYFSVPHLIAQRWPFVHHSFHLSLISAPPLPSPSHLHLNLLFLCPSFYLSSILSSTPYRPDASFTQWLGRWTRKLGDTLFLVICLPILSFRITLSLPFLLPFFSPRLISRLSLIPLFLSSYYFHSFPLPYRTFPHLPLPSLSLFLPFFCLALPYSTLLYPVLSCPVLYFSISQPWSMQ